MKKIYLKPEIDYTVFAKQGDVVLSSATEFIDKNEDQPGEWNNNWLV